MIRRPSHVLLAAALTATACGPVADERGQQDFAFRSASLELPADIGTLPDGTGRALVEANCTACHSAEMLTTQPPLKPAQWAATVKKMREVYKAPVAAADDAAIVAYLAGMNAPQASSPATTVR